MAVGRCIGARGREVGADYSPAGRGSIGRVRGAKIRSASVALVVAERPRPGWQRQRSAAGGTGADARPEDGGRSRRGGALGRRRDRALRRGRRALGADRRGLLVSDRPAPPARAADRRALGGRRAADGDGGGRPLPLRRAAPDHRGREQGEPLARRSRPGRARERADRQALVAAHAAALHPAAGAAAGGAAGGGPVRRPAGDQRPAPQPAHRRRLRRGGRHPGARPRRRHRGARRRPLLLRQQRLPRPRRRPDHHVLPPERGST